MKSQIYQSFVASLKNYAHYLHALHLQLNKHYVTLYHNCQLLRR